MAAEYGKHCVALHGSPRLYVNTFEVKLTFLNTESLFHFICARVEHQTSEVVALSNYTGYVYEYGFSQDGILTAGPSSGNWLEFNEDFCRDKANRLNTNRSFKTMYINASGPYSCLHRAEGPIKR